MAFNQTPEMRVRALRGLRRSGPLKTLYYVQYVWAERWNINGGLSNGGFIESTSQVRRIGPWKNHSKADDMITDVMFHPNTIPGTAEIIEESVDGEQAT